MTNSDTNDHRYWLQKVVDHIEANVEEDVTLEELAERGAMSVYHFSRLFTTYTGLPPMAYLRRRRLLHAAREISAGADILSAAIRFGFSTHSAFGKAFKKVFGCAPSAYRQTGMFRFPRPLNLYVDRKGTGTRVAKAYETEHVVVRNIQPDDWCGLQKLAVDKENSEAAHFDHAWPTDEKGCKGMAEFFSKGDSFWAVSEKDSGEMIGFIGFNGVKDGALDFGHLFHSQHMATETTTPAIRRMIQYVFDELPDVDRLVTHNASEWEGQLEPLKQLGLRKIGEGKGSFANNPDGTPIEFVAHTMEVCRSEWAEKGEGL
jgi:AraC-like DNA-binding protein/RimJ/RimL family protein N-acetyltransferase|tara:strand:- start:13116 stop:14066 length:951 start_codon:yes stop_codon:yes gene_type:complete